MRREITYTGTGINPTATWVAPIAIDMADIRGLAVKYTAEGQVTVANVAGEAIMGIALITNDVDLKKGQDAHFQIKEIGLAVAGGPVAAGDELATDTKGKLVKANSGDFVIGTAMDSGGENENIIIQINKLGYKPAGA